MAVNKRADLTHDELIAMFPKKWKEAKSFNEIKERAEKGKNQFLFAKDHSLNAIWKLFAKFPEVFLFEEYVEDIFDCYKSGYVSISTSKHKQSDNMNEAIDKMCEVAKILYSDLLSSKENNMNIENENKPTNKNSLVSKARTRVRKFDASVQKMFENDETLIEKFKPSFGEKLMPYLIKVRKIKTLGDYIRMLSDKKQMAAFYQKIGTIKEEYDEFKSNVLSYVNEVLGYGAVDKSNAKTLKKKVEVKEEKEIQINSIEELQQLEAYRFKKDSEDMIKISNAVAYLLNGLTDIYLQAGLTPDEVKVEIEAQIELFHKIVDVKRAELERAIAASIIKAKIAEGVKYKHKEPKGKVHSKNPFINDDFNI